MGVRSLSWLAIALASIAAIAGSCSSSSSDDAVDGGSDSGGDVATPAEAGPCTTGSQTDPQNCGACGHDCLGGACALGVCKPVVIASGQLAPTSIAVDAQGVYWTNAGSSTATFADGVVMSFANGAAKPLAPNEPAPDHVHAASGALYWSSVVSFRVNRMANGGGAITQLNVGETDGGPVMGLAVDTDAGVVTWTESGPSFVRTMPLDGGAVTTLAVVDPDAGADASVVPAGIALDPTSIYFSILGPTPSIMRIDRACVGDCEQDLLTEAGVVYPIVSDDTGGYYSDSANHLVSALAGGPAAVDIRGALGLDGGLMTDIAMDADWVYWTEYGPESAAAPAPRSSSGVVVRARKDLSGRMVLASGLNHPRGIAVDDKAIYWTNAGTRTGDCPDPGCFDRADGEVVRLVKPLDSP